jgi:murein DD-endopeptidase MepM/ murein hydrolase activator NlpD
MKRLASILLLCVLTFSACAPAETSLWGKYSTPTAYAPNLPTFDVPAIKPPTPVPTNTTTVTEPILPLPTITFTITPTFIAPSPVPGITNTSIAQNEPILYYAQSGDTLQAIATRFGVDKSEITSPKDIQQTGLIDPGTLLFIPKRIQGDTTPSLQIMPDAELIFSASASDFNTAQFVANAGGHLSTFRQWVNSVGWMTGSQAIERAAYENSISPRILLGLLEYESRWVYGAPSDTKGEDYPMHFESLKYKGLFLQMVWTINQLYAGYYGWRAGTLTQLTFPDGETLRLDPSLNAGTVALQYYFSRQHNRAEWEQILNPNSVNSFMSLYTQMFGDPTIRSQAVNPIFPPGLTQPKMVLPFDPNREWSLTGGPHGAWEHDGPLAAIDFAPSTDHGGCDATKTWVTAAASGLVVRSGNGVVMVDLDGDGLEQTGWDVLYLHIATEDRAAKGTWLKLNDRVGHASCEGGEATGTHLHFARKYNGEWILADGPIPMLLGGWLVHAGAKPYEGTMTRGGLTVTADPVGQSWSIIIRLPDE